MTRLITLFFLPLLLFSGCESRENQREAVAATPVTPTPEVKAEAAEALTTPATSVLLHEPIELQRYEVPSQALLQWYRLRSARPALLIYSNDPLLQATSPAMQKNLLAQLAAQNPAALRFDIADPAILPKMTLQAALQAGLFSAVYWMMPSKAEVSALSVETFREQMLALGALSDEEARTLTLRDGVFSGTVRGVPFHAVHPQAAFAIKGPAVLHFDLSYLAPLYQGEIKTQIYPLIYRTLQQLSDQQIATLAAGFSYSQLSGEIPLGSRFVGDLFAQLFMQPSLLEESMPADWQTRAKALYLPNLFIVDDARKLLLQLVETHPDDPSLHYALYSVSRDIRAERHAALGHLGEAVQRDPVYALEYLQLAPLAREMGYHDEALRMLRLAHQAAPDNPFITLELAGALLSAGQGASATPLLQELQGMPWSATLYPDMPVILEQMLDDARR